MQSDWVGFALETAPAVAVDSFVLGFGLCSAVWFYQRSQGLARSVRLSFWIKLSLFVGLVLSVFLGGAVAVLGYPPLEIQSFLLSILSTEQPNYARAVGSVALIFLWLLVGCVWIEAGRGQPAPSKVVFRRDEWGFLIDDQRLASAFEAFKNDEGTAFDVFKRFADQGNAAAQNNVGVMLETDGIFIESDASAEAYFRRAAEQGVPMAQFKLAALLAGDLLLAKANTIEHDNETDRRLVDGYKWALIAKAQHFTGVTTLGLRGFKKRMSRPQIDEGERLARLWLERHNVKDGGKLIFLIKEAPRVLRRELWGG